MPALWGVRMAVNTSGRAPITCPRCRAVICYVSAEQVRRVKKQAGFGLVPDDSALTMVADAAALRCVTCESSSPPLTGGQHGGKEGEARTASAQGEGGELGGLGLN